MSMAQSVSLVGVALLVLGASSPVLAQPVEPGANFTGMVELAGKQVALPEGTWTLAGSGFAPVAELEPGAHR